MLSIISPLNMAMNMPCCPYAPYCSHNQRPIPPQTLPSIGLGSLGDNSSWNNRMTTYPQTSFNFTRQTQTPLFPSQTLNYLNDQDKLRASSHSYSTPPPPPPPNTSNWSNPTYPVLSQEFTNTAWLPTRTKDSIHGSGPSLSHDNNDYVPSLKYEGLELRDVSPSRQTDFSAISASSQASPAPGTNFMSFNGLRSVRDESPFLSAQPLLPEQLRSADSEARRMSTVSFDSTSPSKHSRTRSRKGSEGISCHICSKSFDRRSNFKSHWETHDKDRQRTVCKVEGCKKTFGRPAEMTRHVNSAHRQKSFACSSCGKDFTRHDILLRHCKDACPVLVKGKGTGKKRRGKDA